MAASGKRSQAESETVDAIEILTEDHRRVDEMFEEYQATKDDADDDDKEQRVLAICVELTVHATVEEEIFYPAAREAFAADADADLLDEAEVEHATVKELVDQLSAMSPAEALYDAKVKVLSEYVRHHVQEEEEKIFPALRDADLDLEALGAEIAQRKEELEEELAEELES